MLLILKPIVTIGTGTSDFKSLNMKSLFINLLIGFNNRLFSVKFYVFPLNCRKFGFVGLREISTMNFFKFAGNKEFVGRLTEIIRAHLGDEHFGVRDLVRESGMSHANVYRHLKAASKKSASHFMREIRLQEAMKMLEKNESTVAEIAYKVGFGSPAYFNCCFHDYYGFPPGELRKRNLANTEPDGEMNHHVPGGEVRRLVDFQSRRLMWHKKIRRQPLLLILLTFLILLLLTLLIYESVHLIRNRNQHIDNLLSFNADWDKSLTLMLFGDFSLNGRSQYFIC